MTIDERLEKLAQRHEALTQTVELIGHELNTLTREVSTMRGFISDVAEGTARLLHTAEIHERRITRLEEKGD